MNNRSLLELPWDQPSTGCPEYVRWKGNDNWTTHTPWSKIDTLSLSLLRKILEPVSSKRIQLEKIIEHKWSHLQFAASGGECSLSVFVVGFHQCLNSVGMFFINDVGLCCQVLSDSQLFEKSLRAPQCLTVRFGPENYFCCCFCCCRCCEHHQPECLRFGALAV